MAFLKRGVPLHMPNKVATNRRVPGTLDGVLTCIEWSTRIAYGSCARPCRSRQSPAVQRNTGQRSDKGVCHSNSVSIPELLTSLYIQDNYTALHVAVQAGKPQVVEALLGYGADVHVKGGKLGETALHVAASLEGSSSRYCAEMLLKSGADPNMRLEVRLRR